MKKKIGSLIRSELHDMDLVKHIKAVDPNGDQTVSFFGKVYWIDMIDSGRAYAIGKIK